MSERNRNLNRSRGKEKVYFTEEEPNMTVLVSFLLSIPVTNTFVKRLFSLMAVAWTDQRNRSSVDLIKSEIQVKVNYEQDCQHILKEKALLEPAWSERKYKYKVRRLM
ncbi:UNVERIFIED_CONTAM: hypothetical protein FKN15_022194 [Acipenser sinensis]